LPFSCSLSFILFPYWIGSYEISRENGHWYFLNSPTAFIRTIRLTKVLGILLLLEQPARSSQEELEKRIS
jgi:hypothetical protein